MPANQGSFFRFVPNFIVQFGIAGLSTVSAAWNTPPIKDEPVVMSNTIGTISFASAGVDTRTTQVFVNLANNHFLDGQGFSAFGVVTSGLDVLSNGIYQGYGGDPDQGLMYQDGDLYLQKDFPLISYTLSTSAKIVIA